MYLWSLVQNSVATGPDSISADAGQRSALEPAAVPSGSDCSLAALAMGGFGQVHGPAPWVCLDNFHR